MIQLGFVAFFFLLSGACGLIYENVWIKQVGTIFGSTLLATTVVLGAFMAGLALGAWWIGRSADRLGNPLRTYAWLEVGIAFFALAFPTGLSAVHVVYRDVLVPAGVGRAGLLTFELLAVSVLLVIPTALMGATLPVLMRFALPWMRRTGLALGFLYAVNTAGAVAGSLAAGFWLIPELGLDATSHVAQAMNLAVGLVALALAAVTGEIRPAADLDYRTTEPAGRAEGAVTIPPPLVHLHVFLCGFAAMLYEIALMKLLPLILGSSTHSFSLMLSAFISGLAIGSAVLGACIDRVRRQTGVLGALLILQGLAFLASIPLYNSLPDLYLFFRSGARLPFGVYQVMSFGICFLVMVIPTFFLGGVLPVAAQLTIRGSTVAGDVGRLYAANTIGNILGTVVTGLILVPHLGFKLTMEIGIALNLLSGLRLVWIEPGLSFRRHVLSTAVVLVLVAAYLRGYPEMDLLKLNAGVFRLGGHAEIARQRLEQDLRTVNVVYAREDETCFVTVTHVLGKYTLRVNGKPDASSGADMLTQKMLAHYPLLLRPDARRALVIGLGSGITAGTALLYPLKSLECAELSPAVVEAAKLFSPWNREVHADRRFSLIVDDGRNYLERAPGRYDVIISEPSNPWVAGIGSLFSVECFRAAAEHLTQGGIMAQWMHTYEMDSDTFRTVVRTFRSVFPHVTLMKCKTDVVMLGSMAPIAFDREALEARMRAPGVKEDLSEVEMTSALVLAANHYIPEELLAEEVGTGDLNTDDHPVLEYRAPVGFYSGESAAIPALTYVHSPHHLLRRFVAHYRPERQEVVALIRSLSSFYPPDALASLLEESLGEQPPEPGVLLMLSQLSGAAGYTEAAREAARAVARSVPSSAHANQRWFDAELAIANADLSFAKPWRAPQAETAARAWIASAPLDMEAWAALGQVLFLQSDGAEAEAALERALELAASAPAVRESHRGLWMIMAGLLRLERRDVAGARAIHERIDGMDRTLLPPWLLRRLDYRLARAEQQRTGSGAPPGESR